MKSIWILNHYAGPPEITGGIRHYKFAENLIKRSYKVTVFAASSQHNSNNNLIKNNSKYLFKESNGVPFIFIRARNYIGNGKARVLNMLDYTIGLLSVSKKIDTDKPDLIYASSVHPLTWISGYLLAKRYKAKFFAETRDLWPETLIAMGKMSRNSIIAKMLYKFEKFIYKNADKLVFTIPGGIEYINSIGLDSSKVRYINNGIDLEEFNYNKNKFVYEDASLDNSDIFKIIFSGSIGKANAINRIIDVAEIFSQKNIKDISFYIFGDGPEKEKLEEYVKDKALNNIIFKGRVEKKYIPNILSKTNLNIFCLEFLPDLFKYGLSPNKMFDYFASGKPIISNVECGFDMLDEYKCGITVKGGSAEALAEGILRFYNMPKTEYDAYCNNALKASQDFDFKILTQKLEDIILES